MGWTSEDKKERGPNGLFYSSAYLGTVLSVEMVDLACMLHAACLLDRWTVLVVVWFGFSLHRPQFASLHRYWGSFSSLHCNSHVHLSHRGR